MATSSLSASTPGFRAEAPAPRRPVGATPWWSYALVAPLLLFLVATFVIPVLLMLARGVTNGELPGAWPASAAALQEWDGKWPPDDALVRTVAADLVASGRAGTLNQVANRLNYDVVGTRSLLFDTSARLAEGAGIGNFEELAALDERWRKPEVWAALRHASAPFTSFYLWAALDRRVTLDGRIVEVQASQAVFVDILLRTFKISLVVAICCALLGYPLAFLLASLPDRWSNPLLILVLLPFWTSALVRTTAWVVLLQTEGVVNQALIGLGLVEAPLALVYNRLGVYVAMTHVLLPFLVLPLFGIMKAISPDELKAASSLGARPATVFRKIYFPQTLPGLTAGLIIVFTLSLGYYITPALVGGGGDQMISTSIAFYTNQSLNWGMAAALSLLLLIPLGLIFLAGRQLLRTVPV